MSVQLLTAFFDIYLQEYACSQIRTYMQLKLNYFTLIWQKLNVMSKADIVSKVAYNKCIRTTPEKA